MNLVLDDVEEMNVKVRMAPSYRVPQNAFKRQLMALDKNILNDELIEL